jgi:hypothetical protein
MKARRNVHTSAFVRLPPELAARVLHFSQCGGRLHTPWLDLDRGWTRLMRVCRRLRSVALSTPSLWSTLHCGAPEWPGLCIMRAKGIPLGMCGEGFSSLVNEEDERYAGPELAWHVLNARRLCMLIPARMPDRPTKASIIYHPLPQIEKLHLMRDSARGIQWPHFLSQGFLGGRSDTLRALTLEKVAFADTDDAPSFPALVHLDMRSSHMSHEVQSVRQLVALLRGAPRLKRLVVQFGGAEGPHGAYEPISLRHLRTLVLEGRIDDLETFTGLLPLPSHHLSLVCDERLSRADTVTPLLATAQRFWGQGPLPPKYLVLEDMKIYLVVGACFELDELGSAPHLFVRFQVRWTGLFDQHMAASVVQLRSRRRWSASSSNASATLGTCRPTWRRG